MFATTAFATEAVVPEQKAIPFYQDYKRGWFWYEQQKAPEKPKEEPEEKHRLPSLKEYTVDQLWDMSRWQNRRVPKTAVKSVPPWKRKTW